MAGFQSASLMVPDHPTLYGASLAITLAGSVAAMSSGTMQVPVARVEYALGLTDTASAAVTSSPVVNAAVPEAIDVPVVLDQAEAPKIGTPGSMPPIPVALYVNAVPSGLEPVGIAVPKLAKVDLAASLQLQRKDATQVISAPVNAELQGQLLEPHTAAPIEAGVAAQPNQNFDAAFQAIPAPSLAVLPDQPAAVPAVGFAVTDAPALALVAAKPGTSQADQQTAGIAPAPVTSQTKLIELPAASPAVVQTLGRAPETAVALGQVASKLTATSGTLPIQTLLPKAESKSAPTIQPLRLINSPQLRKFDLARIHAPVRTPSAALSAAPATAKSGQAGKVRNGGAKDKLVGDVVFHRVVVTVAGSPARPLDVRIGADMKPSIKVGDLLVLVSDRMDPASANRFASAASADEYVSLAALRAAGFSVSYNAATDSISIGAGD